jgi:subtilase family serine protease
MGKKGELAVASALVVLMLSICCPCAWTQASDRVLAAIDPSDVVALGGHHPSWAQLDADAGPVPADLRLEHLTLVLARASETQQALEQFLKNQQDPASSEYHHWLTPLEVGERFGVSLHDIAAVKQWLQSQNLQVDSVSTSRVRINFSGTSAAMAGAFGSEFHYFLANGGKRISVAGPPKIPAALAPVVAGIHGLYRTDYRPLYKSRVGRLAATGPKPNLTFFIDNQPVNLIVPADFAVIYDLNPVYAANITGAGQTIAVIGRSRVYNPDIENLQLTVGMPVKDPVLIIPPDGFDPGPPETVPPAGFAPSADQGEATLDVMRAGSTAPGATIDLVVSASTTTTDGIAIAAPYVVDTTPVPAKIMSLSFSACENEASQQGVAFWDNVFSQAAAEGISVFVASGDSGAAGCETAFQPPSSSQILSPNALCSSSYATCVGGTEFADSTNPSLYWSPDNNPVTFGSALSYIPEGAWNEPANALGTQAASSGGGVSAYIPTPAWQRGPGVPANLAGRYTPDVSFSSAEHDSYFGCFAAGGAIASPSLWTSLVPLPRHLPWRALPRFSTRKWERRRAI